MMKRIRTASLSAPSVVERRADPLPGTDNSRSSDIGENALQL
jgi:hypothetical protein